MEKKRKRRNGIDMNENLFMRNITHALPRRTESGASTSISRKNGRFRKGSKASLSCVGRSSVTKWDLQFFVA